MPAQINCWSYADFLNAESIAQWGSKHFGEGDLK